MLMLFYFDLIQKREVYAKLHVDPYNVYEKHTVIDTVAYEFNRVI